MTLSREANRLDGVKGLHACQRQPARARLRAPLPGRHGTVAAQIGRLQEADGLEFLLFKQAISIVIPGTPVTTRERRTPFGRRPEWTG